MSKPPRHGFTRSTCPYATTSTISFDVVSCKTHLSPFRQDSARPLLPVYLCSTVRFTMVASLAKDRVADIIGISFLVSLNSTSDSRWFPTGKIFFIAPTKPLVAQQASAFPETCGFLNSKVAILTGEVTAVQRAKAVSVMVAIATWLKVLGQYQVIALTHEYLIWLAVREQDCLFHDCSDSLQ